MRYAVVIERADRNYSGYVPDLPGCAATGATVQETMSNLREAIRMHIDGMIEDGQAIPDPTTHVDYINADVIPSDASVTQSRGACRPAKAVAKNAFSLSARTKSAFRSGAAAKRK